MLFSIIPEEIIEKKNEAELVVYLKNGSYIQLMGADNPDRLRGAGPLGFILDEYDTMKEEVWPILQPIVRANGGWAWFVGTPKGKQKLYDLYQLGKSGDPEWGSWLLKASQSGLIPKDQLDNSRKTMSQALYNQEFECDFLEGEGAVFRNVRAICTAKPEKPVHDELYVIGADLGKVQDYTVLTVYRRSTNEQVYKDRFREYEWPFQKKKIKAISKYYNDALVMLDATGLGDPVADDLIRAGVPVEPIKITEPMKKEMIEKLSIWIEQQMIKIIANPNDLSDTTLIEFDNFSYDISNTGKIRYNAREGYHDDIVISHALAIWGLSYHIPDEAPERMTKVQKMYADLKKNRSMEEIDADYL